MTQAQGASMPPMVHDELMLFALDASRDFGEAVSRELGIALSAHEGARVRGRGAQDPAARDCAWSCRVRHPIAVLYGRAQQSVNDKLCRLLFFLGALKDATIAHAARACRNRGATRVVGVASHGVFAEAANTVLGECDLERIVMTDTIPSLRVTDPRLKSRLKQVSSAPLFAEAIRRLHAGGSIVELLGG